MHAVAANRSDVHAYCWTALASDTWHQTTKGIIAILCSQVDQSKQGASHTDKLASSCDHTGPTKMVARIIDQRLGTGDAKQEPLEAACMTDVPGAFAPACAEPCPDARLQISTI